jgi:hypothetical protein
VVPADGPRLGAAANRTPIFERPADSSKQIGYLHAGARVARLEKPYSTEGCSSGWYPIRPRGFVCTDRGATIDMAHPTLVARSLQPQLGEPLPYTYARAEAATIRYERDPARNIAVKEVAKLPKRSAIAVVGSWNAIDTEGARQRLGMMTNGQFVRAEDLKAAEPPSFAGVELGDEVTLPVAFLVKRGVHTFKLDAGEPEKQQELEYHQKLTLTGRFRTLSGIKYWALDDDRWVRHRDVTVVRPRNIFPDFATKDQKWIDISVVTGTLVLYEGRRPIFTTLVSVGRDRLGDPKTTASTALGSFKVIGKQITAVELDPKQLSEQFEVFDVPWALELSSGQWITGAMWHERFGIEYTRGNVELSPADAARVWHWVEPALPEGWHGANAPEGQRTLVVIRK